MDTAKETKIAELQFGKMIIEYFGWNLSIQITGSKSAIRRIKKLDHGITLEMLINANGKLAKAI